MSHEAPQKLEGVTVIHNGVDCDAFFCQYAAGNTAIQLVERETGEPWAKATVNVPDLADALGKGEVFIKDYSENEGMMDALVAAGVVEDTGRSEPIGYTEARIAKLKVKPTWESTD